MKFSIGQPVWIGWTPDRCIPDLRARSFRGTTGTIASGPFEPFSFVPGCHPVRFKTWMVNVGGIEVLVREGLLFPIDDDDGHPETTEQKREMPA